MFAVGSVLSTLLPLLPGAEGKVLTPTFPLVIIGLVWGLHAALRKDWRRTPGWVFHVSALAGMGCMAAAVFDTGGVNSPARFLLLLSIVFTAYFFPAREAWPYFALALVVHALPFAYDAEALHASLLGELLILVPCYWLLTFLLISGKRGMIALRGEADALARRDPLTGIANRRALLEAIERADGPVGLLVLDVDDFKAINTLYGHPGGDRALVFVADALRASSRAVDLPTRLGGDEFALLAPGHRRGRDGGARAAPDGGDPLRRRRAHQRGLGRGRAGPVAAAARGRRGAGGRQARGQGPRAELRVADALRGTGRAAAPCGPRPSAARPSSSSREPSAVALRDLQHRPDEDAVHVAHERPGLDVELEDVARRAPSGR